MRLSGKCSDHSGAMRTAPHCPHLFPEGLFTGPPSLLPRNSKTKAPWREEVRSSASFRQITPRGSWAGGGPNRRWSLWIGVTRNLYLFGTDLGRALATRAAIGAERMGSARDKFIHSRLIGRGIFEFEVVPFPAPACEHCLAIENAAVGRES
jgi:hypothetical protein